MAGDWIKVEKDTLDKPEVLSIAATLGISQEEAFGLLFRLWRWADSNSKDGHALVTFLSRSCHDSVTPESRSRRVAVSFSSLDRIAQRQGLAQAMHDSGWLNVSDAGEVSIPNFGRHMGQSAKARALATERRRDKRNEQAAACHDSVTDLSRLERDKNATREEKRREEKREGARAPAAEPDEEEAPAIPAIATRLHVSIPTDVRAAARHAMLQWQSDEGVGDGSNMSSGADSILAHTLQDDPSIAPLWPAAVAAVRAKGARYKGHQYACRAVANMAAEMKPMAGISPTDGWTPETLHAAIQSRRIKTRDGQPIPHWGTWRFDPAKGISWHDSRDPRAPRVLWADLEAIRGAKWA